MGDSDTAPINNTDSNGLCREDKVFFAHLFTYYQHSHSIQAGSWAKQSTNAVTCSDARTSYRNKWFSKLFPEQLWGESHIPQWAQWGTQPPLVVGETSVPCLGKAESWIVPLQTCVPTKSKRIYTLLTQCCAPKAFLLPPSMPLTPAPAYPQPTHVLFP